MKKIELQKALLAAVNAARSAGHRLRRCALSHKTAREVSNHDIKLDLDFECQALITARLRRAMPAAFVLGEEGATGDSRSPLRWVVDPIDGTVNFYYGIPHAAVSIALEMADPRTAQPTLQRNPPAFCKGRNEGFEPVVGVIYDPFLDELWTAFKGGPARLNGRVVQVSQRATLAEAIVSMGFGKEPALLKTALPLFNQLARKTRKVRLMGSAALALAYVAAGRIEAHIGTGIRLWDVAAGRLLVQCAGGEVLLDAGTDRRSGGVVASNRMLSDPFRKLAQGVLGPNVAA